MLKTMHKPATSSDESDRVLAALRAGIDPVKLTRELAAQHPGDAGFARRLVDTASARLWLASGAPVADVLTMLEVRHRFDLSPVDARSYVASILWAAQHPMDSRNPQPIPTSKETRYAAA
ncbi:MAG: hypothetical protein ACRD3N_02390 [Terracidiphilus sp.]